MEVTFTNVFYEDSPEAANQRLSNLRRTDNHLEIKAYIIEDAGKWRVLRKIRITVQPRKTER